jgi:hypothetical protein
VPRERLESAVSTSMAKHYETLAEAMSACEKITDEKTLVFAPGWKAI